jgi:hypothetical protein
MLRRLSGTGGGIGTEPLAVILSAAKNLALAQGQILRYAQDDN